MNKTTLIELQEAAKAHLKKSVELIDSMEFFQDVAQQAKKLNAIPAEMADKAVFVVSELRLNRDEYKTFINDLDSLMKRPTDEATEVMMTRFNQLKAQQLANLLFCNDALDS